jgi:phosphoribosylamine---glycine ligase
MRVCVIGSGGREHALAHVLARSAEVVVTPGNPGIPGSVDTPPEAVEANLYVVGPEAPLVDGLADRLRAQGRLVFGPGADGAHLEGSKAWMKELVAAAGVPTARYGAFDEEEPALAFLRSLPGPWVVKTDGLAAGKGVLVTHERGEAEADVRAKLSGESFGAAGRKVVIEEGLSGPELSLLAVCDGTRAVPLAPAQDFKRLGDGDTGPNTGGMGAYSPVPYAGGDGAQQRHGKSGLVKVSEDVVGEVMDRFVEPTLAKLSRRGIDYRGVLYAGLMLTDEGPKLLEYNVRFGDPEAQVVLPRLDADLLDLLGEAAAGRLRSEPSFAADAAVTVVLASEGYPAKPRTGDVIEGIDAAEATGATVFCAGVASGDDGSDRLVTAGGRVLDVTGFGATIAAARAQAYAAAELVSWPGRQLRSDIALAASEILEAND